MRLRVLGCHGGESPTHRTTCFLVDDVLALDAGALTRGLTVAEQAKVDNVVLSHVHLDHIRDLALIADNVIGLRKKPLDIHAVEFTASALEKHIFNDVIWPNFTKIPNPSDAENRPTLRIQRFAPEQSFQLGEHTIRTVPVNHPVDCQAIFVTTKSGTLVYSGDTGPTDKLWGAKTPHKIGPRLRPPDPRDDGQRAQEVPAQGRHRGPPLPHETELL